MKYKESVVKTVRCPVCGRVKTANFDRRLLTDDYYTVCKSNGENKERRLTYCNNCHSNAGARSSSAFDKKGRICYMCVSQPDHTSGFIIGLEFI